MKKLLTSLIEIAALACLVTGAALIAAPAGFIVGGCAGLAYVRGLTR